ncbi:uncharacterized protein LOC134263595 [Saccostrea cucullata]|uniref:uncharacterized protein LOC134263595 n=1 Tax=Saccostrea cuccullata TaxID=36930 RepID=UPI002ED2C784
MTILFSFLILINADFVFGLSSPGSTSTTKYASNSPEKNFHSDAAFLHQILPQETTLRMELERNARDLIKQFERMKKDQAAAETEISILYIPIPGQTIWQCDFANITKDFQNFKREIRYISLSFIDLERETEAMNSNILQTVNNSANLINHADLKDQQRNVSNTIKGNHFLLILYPPRP